MKVKRLVLGATLLAVLAVCRFIVHSRSPKYILEHSNQLILYSLQPHPAQNDERISGLFHRSGILGQTRVSDPQLKARLVEALFTSMSHAGGEASCFNPRHGIRAIHNGRTVDVEICFECGTVYLWENNNSQRQFVSQEPQKVFDQALLEAHLPQADLAH